MDSPTEIVAALLYREALLLDRKEWDTWLALYCADAVFWVPAWKNEDTPTNDPDREVSLIYHENRHGLEERVSRIRSRKSVTAMPLPRTLHMVTNILVSEVEPTRIDATASFAVHIFDPRTARARSHFGLYEVTVVSSAETFLIARKKALLMNDRIATTLDFYDI